VVCACRAVCRSRHAHTRRASRPTLTVLSDVGGTSRVRTPTVSPHQAWHCVLCRHVLLSQSYTRRASPPTLPRLSVDGRSSRVRTPTVSPHPAWHCVRCRHGLLSQSYTRRAFSRVTRRLTCKPFRLARPRCRQRPTPLAWPGLTGMCSLAAPADIRELLVRRH